LDIAYHMVYINYTVTFLYLDITVYRYTPIFWVYWLLVQLSQIISVSLTEHAMLQHLLQERNCGNRILL